MTDVGRGNELRDHARLLYRTRSPYTVIIGPCVRVCFTKRDRNNTQERPEGPAAPSRFVIRSRCRSRRSTTSRVVKNLIFFSFFLCVFPPLTFSGGGGDVRHHIVFRDFGQNKLPAATATAIRGDAVSRGSPGIMYSAHGDEDERVDVESM